MVIIMNFQSVSWMRSLIEYENFDLVSNLVFNTYDYFLHFGFGFDWYYLCVKSKVGLFWFV